VLGGVGNPKEERRMLQRVVLMVAQRLYSTVEVYIEHKENTMEYKKIKMKKKEMYRILQLHRGFGQMGIFSVRPKQISGTKPV